MKNKLWGGRFEKQTNPLVEKFTKSIDFDKKLASYDVLGSMIHVNVLYASNYLKIEEARKLHDALAAILRRIQEGDFNPGPDCEDVHTYIQNELQKNAEIGDLALKLHTARSRNDQVVFATKVYCKNEIESVREKINAFNGALAELSKQNEDLIIPGFTHLQHAQPVYLKDYLGAYAEMSRRDSDRLDYISKNIKISLGAGALAGTPIPADQYNKGVGELLKEMQEKKVFPAGFNMVVTKNSLDVVSDRDFIIEILNALAILGMHLSRFAEDFIIWSTKEFDFVEIDESFCTGSSLMPQKKNPDVLELVRGYAGRLCGNLVSVLTMMKGLPLSYNRDMQLDKEPLFNSLEIVDAELSVLAGLIKSIRFNKDKIKEHLKDEALYATDLVYYLVDKGMAFKEAHSVIGRLISVSIKTKPIKEMTERELKEINDKIEKHEILKYFDPEFSASSKKSIKRD